MIDYRERRLKFWCQKVLPLVYDESLSYYELLCKIMKHLSEAETDVSALEQWLEELDAAAVKKVYSEYPLKAVKEGNTVKLELRSHKVVTSVAPAEGSPITVDGSGAVHTGPLDENDPGSPVGTTSIINNAILDIENATTTSKGAMSAEDKQKVDRLYNTFVSSGDNIVVSSTTSANGDTTYNVAVDPAFKASIDNELMLGNNYTWNSMLNGNASACFFASPGSSAPWMLSVNTTYNVSSYDIKNTHVANGMLLKSDDWAGSHSVTNYTGFGLYTDTSTPFTRITAANPVVSGDAYFTTLDDIEIKGKFYGTGVANRQVRIYLLSQSNASAAGFYGNTEATHGDNFFPSSNCHYVPAYIDVTTDSNGEFTGTMPVGSQAVAYGTTLPRVATGAYCMLFTIYGNNDEVFANVSVEGLRINIKSNLQD